MATKPGSLPRWADVSGDIVEPTSGEKDVGWEPDTKPPAQYFNWWQNLVYQWMQYLNDGALSGNHSVAGTLSATGAASLGSTLGVTGLVTATAGLTAAANQHVTVSGTGQFKHGLRTRYVGGGSGYGSGVNVDADGNLLMNNAADIAFYDVPLEVGKRLVGISVRLTDSATGPTTISGELFEKNSSALGTSLAGPVTSDGSGTAQFLPFAYPLNITLGSPAHVVKLTCSGAGSCLIHRVAFDYDEP